MHACPGTSARPGPVSSRLRGGPRGEGVDEEETSDSLERGELRRCRRGGLGQTGGAGGVLKASCSAVSPDEGGGSGSGSFPWPAGCPRRRPTAVRSQLLTRPVTQRKRGHGFAGTGVWDPESSAAEGLCAASEGAVRGRGKAVRRGCWCRAPSTWTPGPSEVATARSETLTSEGLASAVGSSSGLPGLRTGPPTSRISRGEDTPKGVDTGSGRADPGSMWRAGSSYPAVSGGSRSPGEPPPRVPVF